MPISRCVLFIRSHQKKTEIACQTIDCCWIQFQKKKNNNNEFQYLLTNITKCVLIDRICAML